MDAWCAPHSRSVELTSNTSKTRHQKRFAETGGRNGDSIAEFRTRRPAHICESSRYRAVFERPSYASPTRDKKTGNAITLIDFAGVTARSAFRRAR